MPLTRPMERHIQTALAVVLTGIVGWVGVSVTDSREQIARLQEQVESLKSIVTDMRMDTRQAATLAAEIAVAKSRLESHAQRLTRLEQATGVLRP